MGVYIRKMTEIDCPDCTNNKVIQETKTIAYCSKCGSWFHKMMNCDELIKI